MLVIIEAHHVTSIPSIFHSTFFSKLNSIYADWLTDWLRSTLKDMRDSGHVSASWTGTVRGTRKKTTLFSGHYLRNRSTSDIGVLGYIGIV